MLFGLYSKPTYINVAEVTVHEIILWLSPDHRYEIANCIALSLLFSQSFSPFEPAEQIMCGAKLLIAETKAKV